MLKFELPDENAIVLKHIGIALQNIAKEMSGVSSTVDISRGLDRTKRDLSVAIDELDMNEADENVATQYATLAADAVVKREGPFYWSHPESDSYGMVDTEDDLKDFTDGPCHSDEITEEEYNELLALHGDTPLPLEVDDVPPPPANELPWDKRIHSANKTKNSDGTWRNARKPKDYDGDWAEYIKSIELELRTAMSDVPPPPADELPIDELPDDELPVDDDLPPPPFNDLPADDDVPPPPAEEPTPFDTKVTPPANVASKTFPELMSLITSNAKEKGSVAKVQAIIKAHNYGSLQTLVSVGGDAISIVYHELEGQL